MIERIDIMSTLEIILLVGGIVFLIASIATLIKTESFLYFPLLVIAILMIVLSIVIFDDATHTKETTEILMTVKDKNKESRFVGVPGKGGHSVTYYYLTLDNNKKMKVSKTVYNKYNNNDTILCVEKTIYRIDRDTKEKLSVSEVEYFIKN